MTLVQATDGGDVVEQAAELRPGPDGLRDMDLDRGDRLSDAIEMDVGVTETDPGMFTVQKMNGTAYEVDLEAGSCSCTDSVIRGPGCKHAIRVAAAVGASVNQTIPNRHRVEEDYQIAYDPTDDTSTESNDDAGSADTGATDTRETVFGAVSSLGGRATIAEVAGFTGGSKSNVGWHLRKLADAGRLGKTKDGHTLVYMSAMASATDPDPAADPMDADGLLPFDRGDEFDAGEELPVNRHYDFDHKVVRSAPEFIDHQDVLGQIRGVFAADEALGRRKNARLVGPPGTGKTQAVRKLAAEEDAVLFTIQCRFDMESRDFLGSAVLTAGPSRWVDGPLTKALIASRERKVWVLFDEANRMAPEAASALYDALDDRCSVTLDQRGGEVIEGNPANISTIATMNQGDGHFVEPMDDALLRRYPHTYRMKWLGQENPDDEADLLCKRTPIARPLADKLVEVSNTIRDRVTEDSPIETGIPTSAVIGWAASAYGLDMAGFDEPVYDAGLSDLAETFFGDDDVARSSVESLLKSEIKGEAFVAGSA